MAPAHESTAQAAMELRAIQGMGYDFSRPDLDTCMTPTPDNFLALGVRVFCLLGKPSLPSDF